METVFRALDEDASGELDYVEFCHQLGSCKRRDPLMLGALTRYSVPWRTSDVAVLALILTNGFSFEGQLNPNDFLFFGKMFCFLGPFEAIPR